MTNRQLASSVIVTLVFILFRCISCSRLANPRYSQGTLLVANKSTRSLLTSLPNVLENAYTSASNMFPYYDASIAKWVDLFEPEFNVTSVLSRHILSTSGPFSQPYFYYSGNIMQSQFTALRTLLNITSHVHYLIPGTDILSKITANVWMGMGGVQATAHYDAVYNVYAHYHGVKVFRLLPPAAVQYLQVHGRMHPYACQSRLKNIATGELFNRPPFCISGDCSTQANLADDNAFNITAYKEYYALHVIEVTMHPGDVLVIPPFWFHEVVAQTAALSVSLWWDARELDVMDEIYALPLPLESSWDDDLMIMVGEMFAARLVEAVCLLSAHELMVDDIEVSQFLTSLHILQLIVVRYKEDWSHRSGPNLLARTQHISTDVFSEVLSSRIDEEIWRKVNAAADQRADVFVEGFLSEENFVQESSLFQPTPGRRECQHVSVDPTVNQALHTTVSECDNTASAEKIVENQLAVLTIKLTDYIEDVFLQVAGMVQERRCEVCASDGGIGEGECKQGNGLPYKLAVKLLLDWVEKLADESP